MEIPGKNTRHYEVGIHKISFRVIMMRLVAHTCWSEHNKCWQFYQPFALAVPLMLLSNRLEEFCQEWYIFV